MSVKKAKVEARSSADDYKVKVTIRVEAVPQVGGLSRSTAGFRGCWGLTGPLETRTRLYLPRALPARPLIPCVCFCGWNQWALTIKKSTCRPPPSHSHSNTRAQAPILVNAPIDTARERERNHFPVLTS